MSTDALEREIEHTTTEEADSENVLATFDERQQQHIQMQQLRDATVERGLLKIPVKRVTTAKNSEQWVVEPDHPVLDEKELRQFYEKPVTGWTTEYDLVKLLEWYCNGSQNPYDLQLHHVYCQYDKSEDEWTIVKPPTYTYSGRKRLSATWSATRRAVARRRPKRSNAVMFTFMLVGLFLGAMVTIFAPVLGGLTAVVAPALGFLAMTILGMAVLEP